MAPEQTLAIDMRGISKSFGVVKALVEADLMVARGSIHGLVGQNGAGKSTIIKVLAGILKPDAGTSRVNGETDVADNTRSRNVSVVLGATTSAVAAGETRILGGATAASLAGGGADPVPTRASMN